MNNSKVFAMRFPEPPEELGDRINTTPTTTTTIMDEILANGPYHLVSDDNSDNQGAAVAFRSSIIQPPSSIMSLDTSDKLYEMALQLPDILPPSESSSGVAKQTMEILSTSAADPDLFGDTTGEMTPNNNNNTTTNDSNNVRFSISRGSSPDLFDTTFQEEHHHHHNDTIRFQQQQQQPQPRIVKSAETVSEEVRKAYLQETPDMKLSIEESLQAEMEGLSFDDQQKVIFDVHGIPQHHLEVSAEGHVTDFLLQRLDETLKLLTVNNPAAEAYLEARAMNPLYVQNKDFQRMFLRFFASEHYISTNSDAYAIVRQAASKMIEHFSFKKQIFGGGEILGRRVRLSDLSRDDRNAMDSGAMQILPNRDASDRIVTIYSPNQRTYKTIENWLRAMWYIYALMARQDAEQGGNGLVVIICWKGWLPISQRDPLEDVQKVSMLRDAIPNRIAALHFTCNEDSEEMKGIVKTQKLHFFKRKHRVRIREHIGKTHEETALALETFGIPIDRSVFLPNGELALHWYHEWVRCRQSIEAQEAAAATAAASTAISNNKPSSTTPTTTSILPRKFDVLFGRGKINREHIGNLRCAYLVERHLEEYEQASKQEKTDLAQKIVDTIAEANGRFLKKYHDFGWQEVDNNVARDKVTHFFRNLRSNIAKGKNTKEESVVRGKRVQETTEETNRNQKASSFL